MALKIVHRQDGDVTIIELHGKITIGSGDVELRSDVKSLLDGGSKKLILNLKHIKYVDSAGVGELVSTYTSATKAGAQLALTCLSSKILDLLQITQLLQVFDTYVTLEEAVEELKGS